MIIKEYGKYIVYCDGYGEPTFIDRDGVVYLGGSEESE